MIESSFPSTLPILFLPPTGLSHDDPPVSQLLSDATTHIVAGHFGKTDVEENQRLPQYFSKALLRNRLEARWVGYCGLEPPRIAGAAARPVLQRDNARHDPIKLVLNASDPSQAG
jgi:hypothetical protein